MDGKFLYWAALIVAVLANILANVALKASVLSVEKAPAIEMLVKLATRPVFWVGVFSAGLLFIAYLFALRGLELGVAYIFVTVSAIIGISIASFLLFDENLNLNKILGILMIIGGLGLVFRSS